MFFQRYPFKPISNAGKMALTNYILQTLICILIFYGFGWGKYNYYSRSELLIWVALIWLFLVSFSTFWLSKFQYGPLEWTWRRLTYGKLRTEKQKTEMIARQNEH